MILQLICYSGVDYLSLTDHKINRAYSDMCKNHYKMVGKVISCRKCVLCSCDESPSWNLARDVSVREGEVADSIAQHDWMCSECTTAVSSPVRRYHESKFAEPRSKVLTAILEKLDKKIGCLMSDMLDMYRSVLRDSDITDYHVDRE